MDMVCPDCGEELEAPGDGRRRRVRCPECGASFVIRPSGRVALLADKAVSPPRRGGADEDRRSGPTPSTEGGATNKLVGGCVGVMWGGLAGLLAGCCIAMLVAPGGGNMLAGIGRAIALLSYGGWGLMFGALLGGLIGWWLGWLVGRRPDSPD